MRSLSSEQAQGLVEYALLLVLIAVVVIGGLLLFGDEVQRLYELVTAADPFN